MGLKAEDIAKLSDQEIGMYFSGSFGPRKFHDAVALIRFLASGKVNQPPKPRPFEAA